MVNDFIKVTAIFYSYEASDFNLWGTLEIWSRYFDVIYEKPSNEKLIDTLEWSQYNATLAVTGAIKGTSK